MYKFFTIWSRSQETGLTDLDMLIDAANLGDLETVNRYINKHVHQQDKKNEALYQALKNRHTECAKALKVAIDKRSENEILSRHFYAAGMGGMYNMIFAQDDDTSRPEPPVFISQGNVEVLKKKMSNDPVELSNWLYDSIRNMHFTCVNILLKAGAQIQPNHYYAAGRLAESNPIAANDFYKLLYAFDTGAVLRDERELDTENINPLMKNVCNQQ